MLTRLILQNYRNHSYMQWQFDKRFVFLCGPNGSGKTNVLEAISLLNLPKGIRSCEIEEFGQYKDGKFQDWTVFYDLSGSTASIECRENQKTLRLHHKIVLQKQLLDFVHIFWVAPENDRLFAGSPSERRNFLHKLIVLTDHEFQEIYNQYTRLIQERNQILKMPKPDANWLDSLEIKIASFGEQIYTKRNAFLDMLNEWIQRLVYFSNHRFTMIDERPEDMVSELCKNRTYDQLRGGSKVGPHKSDLVGYRYDMPVHLCSNGQQCVALFAILLGIVKQYSQIHNVLFLIDEVFSHLDKENQKVLLDELSAMPTVQTFMTATEPLNYADVQYIVI